MKRWFVLAALIALPAAAWADPVTLIAFAATALGASQLVVAGILLVGGAINSYEARRKQRAAAARARAAYNAALQDRTTTVLRADPPWQIVYGRAIVPGYVMAMFLSDKTGFRDNGDSYTRPDALQHLVVTFATHPCQALHEIYIDGVPLGALDGNGNITGGEFYTAKPGMREISIAAGASSPAQTSAVTVLSAWDQVLSSTGFDSGGMVAGTYTLSAGDTVINNTGANAITVSFTLAQDLSTVRVQKHLGNDTTVDAYLNSVVPAEWTASDLLRGDAYCVITLDLENQRFQGGPPNITFDVSGKLLYDPRSGTTVWSDNPALCVRDFLIGEYGYDCDVADVSDASVIVAANACDTATSFDTGGVVTNGARYTCNGVFTTDQAKEAVLEDLEQCMAGTVTPGAQWLVQAGAWVPPVMALTDDDLDGQVSIVQGGAGLDDTFNSVRGQYVPAGATAAADFDLYTNAAFVAADGAALYEDRALPFTNDKARCRNLARIYVERNRDSLIARYPAKLRAWPLQVGDRVTVTSAEYGWTAKTFIVTDWQFGLTAPVTLTLQEDHAEAYDLADAATSDPARNTALPNPWVVAAPTNVVVTSGTGVATLPDGSLATRVRVAWNAITDPYLADGSGAVLVRWRRQFRDPPNVWQTLPPVPASEIYTLITGVQAGASITVEVRLRNGVGAPSPPVYGTHVVGGNGTTLKTAQIELEAATTVLLATGAGGMVTADETNIIGGPTYSVLATLNYTNTTGGSVVLQMEANLSAKFTTTPQNAGTKRAWLELEVFNNTTLSYVGTVLMPRDNVSVVPLLVVDDTLSKSYTLVSQIVLPNAQSVQVRLRAAADVSANTTPDSTVTINHSDSLLRLAVIKR